MPYKNIEDRRACMLRYFHNSPARKLAMRKKERRNYQKNRENKLAKVKNYQRLNPEKVRQTKWINRQKEKALTPEMKETKLLIKKIKNIIYS